MRYLCVFFIALVFISCPDANAQKKKADKADKAVEDAMEKMFGITIQPSREYSAAEVLAVSAIENLKKGNVNMADSLIHRSIQLYPVKKVFEYVKELVSLPDHKKASYILDVLYKAVEAFPASVLQMEEPFPSTYKDGKMISGIKEYEKPRALFNYGYESYKIGKAFGNVAWLEMYLSRLDQLQITNTSTKTYFDFEYHALQECKRDLFILRKEFDLAIQFASNTEPLNQYQSKKNAVAKSLSWVYFQKGDYNKVLEVVKDLDGDFITSGYHMKFMTYAVTGQVEEALSYHKKLSSGQYFFLTNDIFYYLAVIDLHKKEYQKAIVNLDSALHFKTTGFMKGFEALYIEHWKVYKALGDAYQGLGEYERARDNYTISLLYYPDYEPAVAALTSLESDYARQSSTDKAGPVITLTDPSSQRGLKIKTNETAVTIKGLANDPSGIKEVMMNGQPVFSRFSGEFWGDVNLANGSNKITISATDQRGNKTVQVFDIEKTTGSSEITALPERQGANYALLLAAQNYSDAEIPSLENPVGDAIRLKLILKNQYNFDESNIISLFNPEKNDIKRQLLELTNIIKPEDNLVIFYAGHGIWIEKEKKGYWMLIDARLHDANSWLPNKDVLDLIAKLPARNTLLITDACFSGSVFKTRGIEPLRKEDAASTMIQRMNEKISRVAITSGNDTEVPDKSVFMKYLVKALSENKEKYLTAQKMFINHIIEAVMTETKTEPRYGTLELAGHVGGDFIFIKK